MNGIRVWPSRWGGIPLDGPRPAPAPIPRDKSSFEFFFEPILPDLGRFYWVRLPTPATYNPDSGVTYADVEALDALCPVGEFVPPNTFLPEFAHFVIENWTDFDGVLEPPACGVLALLELGDDRRAALEPLIDISFTNVDGAFWVMHAKDESLIERVEAHIRRFTAFHTERVLFPYWYADEERNPIKRRRGL